MPREISTFVERFDGSENALYTVCASGKGGSGLGNGNGRVPGWAWKLIAGAACGLLAVTGGWWVSAVDARSIAGGLRADGHAERIAEIETQQAVMGERLSHIKETTDVTAGQVRAMYRVFLESGLLVPADGEH